MKTATKRTVVSHKVAMERKSKALDTLRSEFSKSRMTIVTDYRGSDKGLSVKDMTALRRKLREAKAEYLVVKNTLARKVANEAGITGLDSHFNNPTAIVVAYGDPVMATKALVDFQKDHKGPKGETLPVIKAAYLDGEVLDAAKIQQLANLPSREEIYGKLLGILVAPTRNLLALLNEPGRRMATILDQVSKKESAA
ncbi:MAG: 50S ribosomal protein L10 [Candidatus Xenobia bacterium]